MKDFIALLDTISPYAPNCIVVDDDMPLFPLSEKEQRIMEQDAIAADLILASQTDGRWAGLVFTEQQGEETEIGRMVAKDYLVEIEHAGWWSYHLSFRAISTIYFKQSEEIKKALREEVKQKSKPSKWEQLGQKMRYFFYRLDGNEEHVRS